MSARPEADEASRLERRTVRTIDARSMRTSPLFDALPPYLGGCVIVSAEWGRDVSKRAVYVGRCEPS